MHTRLPLLVLCLTLASGVAAQDAPPPAEPPVRAITQDGRVVLLYADGTWEEDGNGSPTPPPPEPEAVVVTEEPAPPAPPRPMPPRTVTGGGGYYQIRYDASRWRESPDMNPAEFDLSYQLPYGAGLAATIFEIAPIELPVIRDIVIENARQEGAAQVEVIDERKAKVAGGEMLRLTLRLNVNGLDVTMVNSMHSSERGTLQVITWTSTALWEQYRDELMRFQDAVEIL